MIPVILSGGSGTRLWPVSRVKYPKQFADLFEESLFNTTLRRLIPMGSPWTITTNDLRVLTDRSYDQLKISKDQVIYEPFGKNTAPAIAVLVWKLMNLGRGNEVVGIFPADQFVEKESEFIEVLKLAEAQAQAGEVVTIGLRPTFPATGYGYIEVSNKKCSQAGAHEAFVAKGFREKPTREKAEEFIREGTYFWNSGMFIFKVSVMKSLLEKNLGELWRKVQELKPDLSNLESVYRSIDGISIDYGVMEKLASHVCIPCDVGWSDVGSWDEVFRFKADEDAAIQVGGSDNRVLSQDGKLFAFIDVSGLRVVETSDAVLVMKKGSSQKVKEVVEALKTSPQHKNLLVDRNFEIRPWGRFEILRDTEDFKSKVIHVEPGHQLSYQSHAKRAEHWVIIKGEPEVVLNDVTHRLKPGESIFIPQGAKHRMRNTTQSTVEFVEVQVGSYFGEDDIVRYQDDYKR